MRNIPKFCRLILMTTALSGLGSRAAAQQSETELAAVDEIIVTATKRQESLQNVPISITALTNEALEQRQVASFDDYAKLLPSVSYQSFGPGQTQLYFRGIATGGDGLAIGPLPATGVYLDEIPVTTIYGAVDIHAYDLARVEALAGPQGTLYGASSLSGTLRLITNKPDPTEFAGGYDVELNKFGKGDFGGTLEGFVNVPLAENVALRASGFYEHVGGYIDNVPGTRTYQRPRSDGEGGTFDDPLTVGNENIAEKDYNDVDTYGGRAALRIDLDDDWTVTPSLLYQHQEANGQFLFDPRVGDLQNKDFTESRFEDEWALAALTIQGKISDWDVTYSGSLFKRTVDNVADYSYFTVAYDSYPDYNYLVDAAGNDIDPTQTVRGYDEYSKMAHELRVSSPATERLRLTAGLFWQRQVDDRIAEYIIPGVRNAVNPFSPPLPGAGPDDVYFTDVHRVDRDYAMFGEASFDITPAIALTAGIRGFIAHNTLHGFSGSIGALNREIEIFGCPGTTTQQCPNIDKKYVESGETHKVNLTWKVDPTKLLYATYSTGFRPGGNNRDAFQFDKLQSIPPYKADTLTNYEIGWKTSWLGGALRVNGALFWEEWKDIQYSLPGILGIFYTVNAGTARSRGIEGDVRYSSGGVTLSANGTYVDAELTEPFCALEGGCEEALFAPKGTRLPVTPKLKLTATARYDFDLGPNRAFAQASANHQSGTRSYLTDEGEAALGPTEGFTTFDVSAGLRWSGMSFEAFLQNAFDKRGILSKNTVCAPSICGAYARQYPIKPQFFGVRVGQKF